MDPNTLIQLEASITGLISRILQQATVGNIPLATETVNGLTRLANTLTSTDTDRALTAAQGKALKDTLDQVNLIIASNDASLDTLQKVVNYIKANSSSIDTLNQSVSFIELELVNVVRTNDSRLTDAREWTAATVSQAEAEAGTATTRRAFTAQRVRQSIAAYTQPFSAADRSKLDGIAAGAQVNVPTDLSFTQTATNGTVVSSTGANATIPPANVSLAGLMTSADKAKLEGIQAGAQVNVATNLGYTTAASSGTVTSSTGNNATLPAATTSLAGLLTASDKTKLDGIAAGAQVNVPTNLSIGTRTATTLPLVSSTGTNVDLPLATAALAGTMAASDKTKLDGIAAGAQVNVATNLGITAGTTAGPVITSSTGSSATLPTATASASGVITTGTQTFAGQKNFNATIGGSINGNAATATVLQTPRTINGVNFDGSANITINAVDSTARIAMSEKGAASGVATLDASGKIPLTQLNDAVLGQVQFIDLWNAATNTPTLPATPTKKGDYYIVSVGGTLFGLTFEVGDWIIANGDAWGKVDNTDAVSSVAGRTGNITLTTSDIGGLGTVALLNTNASTANYLRGDGTWVTPPNTTYSEITEAEITAGTSSTLRTITGRRLQYALTNFNPAWASLTGIPETANRWPTFEEVTGKPTTLAGFGITDGVTTTDSRLTTNLTYTASSRVLASSTGSNVTLPQVTTSTDGLMIAADKVKLNGIEAGAQVNVPTNLSYTTAATTGTVVSSTGNNATIPAATTSVAGLMTSADKSKLDGIAAGATANTGTVTSIAVNVPTGLAVTGSPVTSAGTISINYASGYSIPTTAKQGNWDTAYGWGNHASAGYLTSLAHNHGIANAGGTQQFTFGVNENIRFAASGAASIAFDPATKTITVSSTNTNTTYTAGTGLSLTGTQFSLSGVSFSAADKTKLDGIQAGAQANVATNLSYTAAATNGVITSSTGTNATLPAATTSAAGLMTNADKSKLDGIDAGAQVNAVTSVAGKTGAVVLAKADVGLSNVDNTADSSKSVASANTLTTARTINGTSFNGSANITTANWGTARTLTVGNTGKSVNGSGNVSWSLSEIGAQADLGFTPVQQGGGTDQGSNKVYIGWGSTGGTLRLQVDSTNFANNWPISVTGNSATATTLQTARTINGTSFNGSANITTSNWGTARNVTIGGTTRSVNGSTNLTWSLSDIGALGTSGSQKIVKPAHADNSDAYHLELNSPEGSSEGEVSLRFHQDNRFYGQIRMRLNGFHFTQGHSGEYRDLYAGVFNGDLANKGWKRFHLATNESTPLPPANSGPGRWFVRLSPANTVNRTYGGRVTVNGGWSHSAIMGICEKEFSFHYDGAIGELQVVDNRVSALTGAAADNIRIGDITIVSGFVGFYIWSNNSNVPFVHLDLYNYPTDERPTVTGWEADSFPVRTPVTYFDLDISGTGRNIHFRSSPLGVRRGVVGVVANNDYWSVYGGGDTSDGGYMDIATGDNGTEPIYVSQFVNGPPIPIAGGNAGTLHRRATLLDTDGNTTFPGSITSTGTFCNGLFRQAEGVSTGTVNGAQANVWQINDPGSTRTVSITNTESVVGSLTYILRMVGNRATNWPANINWSDGVAPILGPNWTIVVLTRINSTWFGSIGPSR